MIKSLILFFPANVLFLIITLISSEAKADFFDTYNGTEFEYSLTTCQKGKCLSKTFKAEVTLNGIYHAGEGVYFRGRLTKTKYGSSIGLHSAGDNGFDIDVVHRQGSFSYTADSRFIFSNGKCRATYTSNMYTGTYVCKILKTGVVQKAAKDDPEACKAVMDVKAKIEGLIREERKFAPCDLRKINISNQIDRLSTGIKGANCASRMTEIDRVLQGRAPSCRLETPTGELGVRG